jgi:hypothetical protein
VSVALSFLSFCFFAFFKPITLVVVVIEPYYLLRIIIIMVLNSKVQSFSLENGGKVYVEAGASCCVRAKWIIHFSNGLAPDSLD